MLTKSEQTQLSDSHSLWGFLGLGGTTQVQAVVSFLLTLGIPSDLEMGLV